MAEYIEREALSEKIIRKKAETCDYWTNDVKQYRAMQGYGSVETAVDNFLRGYNEAVDDALGFLDAADVVEVVRCQYCIYFLPKKMLCTHEGNMVFNTGKTTYPECFCSYGERRAENAVD